MEGCDLCQCFKPTCNGIYGLLQPILAAEASWKRVTTDLIVKLSNSVGFDANMVVVEKNTKLAHFTPTTKAIDAKDVALYIFSMSQSTMEHQMK